MEELMPLRKTVGKIQFVYDCEPESYNARRDVLELKHVYPIKTF